MMLLKRENFMQTIYQSLGFVINDKYISGLHEYVSDIPTLPQRLNRSLKKIKPKSLFIIKNKPIILFFDKSVDKEKIFKQCWNFSEAPIIIIENDVDFDIYNGFDYILKNGKFLLKEIAKKDELNYISIISGKYFENANDIFNQKTKKVDKKLLENIKEAREKLLALTNHTDIANALLGRIIFIRYLIDRKVLLKFEGRHKSLSNEEFKEILSSKERTYNLFKYLKSKDGFNGDWFPIENNEEDIVNEEHLSILKELISGTDIKTKQGSLFDIYDFSIIPIEFISNVYENFIGEENQKKDGAYYTPTFLVDYILKYTVDEYFKNNPKEYNCKVLDPACGSGIFLVETLRKLIAQYEKLKKRRIEAEEIVQLVKDNVYGIDYNRNALQISVFSLYLTMLDYQTPTDIEEFRFPYLLESEKNEDEPNFFYSDFFNIEASFNIILKEKKLDFIIGNPPYGRSTIKKGSFADKYIKSNKIKIGNNDIVQPFMVRVKDLVTKNSQISFIVTSKVLYNLQSKEFRTEHFFNQFKINHILELSSVRKEIFENADTPVTILFYEYCKDKKEILENRINYTSMKPSPYFEKLKTLFISKSDFKRVQQSKILESDYLWKILVHGSYLDFNFIKRLKEYKIIEEQLIYSSTGIKIGNKKNKIPDEYFRLPYIETKQFKPFYLVKNEKKWTLEYAEGIREIKTFTAPSLLLSLGVNTNLEIKTAVLHKDAIFPASITSVKTNSEDELYGIMGFLNSILFKYYVMNIASSVGIEREQIHNPEKFSLPYIHSDKVIKITKKLEKYSQNDFAQYNKEFDDLKKELDEAVLETLKLSKQEKVLIDYSANIIIPWVMQKQYDVAFESLGYKDERIKRYLQIFIEHYTKLYKHINKQFSVKIYWDKYAIGIYFNVLDKEPKEKIEWIKEPNIQNFLKLSSGKTLENLFIQKDIKGFESDGFYVIKPNEYKNWHEAIGYLDFYEFEKAILGAGKRGNNV